MTDHKAYWSRLEEAARAEAGFNGAAKPNVRAILDRILDAAAPIPAGIAYAAAADRALEVAADEMERLTENLRRLANAHGCPDDVPVIPWLIEHGLAREVDGRIELVPLGPRAAAPTTAQT